MARHANEELIERFYKAFDRHDAASMAACYAPNVRFHDPVFLDLEGPLACGMWKMLCERGKDLRVEVSNIKADDTKGSAHWDATYTFSVTGRNVLNRIDATFELKDGKIIAHRDDFDLWKWTRMALGVKGTLLGWLPPVQNAVRKQARKGLDEFLSKSR